MKRLLYLYTNNYPAELRDFAAASAGCLAVRGQGARGTGFYINAAYEASASIAESCAALLEHIAIQENPIYRHSTKLKAFASTQLNNTIHIENVRQLKRYLRENNRLHLEGYVTFRMEEYREQLDMIMFSLIKKFKLTER